MYFIHFVGQNNLGFLQFPFPANGGVWASTSPALRPPFSTLGKTSGLLAVPPKTTLSFTTAPMVAGDSQEPFPVGQAVLPADADETDGDFVECYVDFSEYYKAIEIHGEDYVINSVQL